MVRMVQCDKQNNNKKVVSGTRWAKERRAGGGITIGKLGKLGNDRAT